MRDAMRESMSAIAEDNYLRPFRDGVDAFKWLQMMGPAIAGRILGVSRATLYRRAQLGRGILTHSSEDAEDLRQRLGIVDGRTESKDDKIAEALTIRRDEGLSTRAIADRLGVSQSTVARWLRGYHLTDDVPHAPA